MGTWFPCPRVAEWEIRREVEILRNALPNLAAHYGVSYSIEGRSAEQNQTMSDVKKGLIVGLTLIYLVLAWVFASYGYPLLGIDLTILSKCSVSSDSLES